MRNNYDCIGAYLDIEGVSIVRFSLSEKHYRIIKSTSIDGMNSHQTMLNAVNKIAKEESVDAPTIDLLCNFSPNIKRYLLDNWQGDKPLRIRTTNVSTDIESYFFNLFSIISENRIGVKESEIAVINALTQIKNVNKEKIRRVYEGSETLSQILFAVLHSICWLESQQIEHGL